MDLPNNECYTRVYVNGDTVRVTELSDGAVSDTYGNKWYDLNSKYIKSSYGKTVNGEWVTDTVTPEDYIRHTEVCYYDDTPRCEVNDSIDSYERSPYYEGDTVAPHRDYQRRDYGSLVNGVWETQPVIIDCKPKITRVVITGTNVGDWEFTYENGVLIAREEGRNDLLEPENNTVIYT